jgi:hypothetical protein
MAQGIKERFDSPEEEQRLAGENVAANLRVAIPGIVTKFDKATQTVSVQPAISENVRIGQGEAKPTNLPLLTDVPIAFPRAGGYCLTFPAKKGDECLLVFSDMCIDGWWQSGGIQNQMETRRHDLSDAIAILGITSVPQAVSGYSGDSVMLRNEEKSSFVEIDGEGNINITSPSVNITAPTVNISGDLTIGDIAFTTHKHGGVTIGSGETSEPR